jgi:hypothetical protein
METENKVSHTPGPWKFAKYGYHEQIWSDKVVNGDQKHICNVFTSCVPGLNGHEIGRFSRIDRDEQLANAKLIAAAPELLRSCMQLLQCRIDHLEEWGNPDDWYEVVLAKEAIRKATE